MSLAEADGRLLTRLRAQHAAEAAAEAAGVVVSDRLLELHEEALDRRVAADVIALALTEPALAVRCELAAQEVLATLHAELQRVVLARRSDELSVRAEVRLGGTDGVARVGVRAP
jgi:hypothetical protein